MTAADLARLYGVTVSTIHRWAAQDNWAHSSHPRQYNPADADKSWRKRHTRRIANHLTKCETVSVR